MITTKDIAMAKPGKDKKIKVLTTKDIDVSPKPTEDPVAPTGPFITTHNIEQFQKKVKKRGKKK